MATSRDLLECLQQGSALDFHVQTFGKGEDLSIPPSESAFGPEAERPLVVEERSIADEVDGSRSRHLGATWGLLSSNPSKGAIRHADYHRGP